MSQTLFPGTSFRLNGTDYTVPSLSLRQFKENFAVLTAPIAADESIVDQADRILPVVLLAVQRNYPEVTLENLYDWVDLSTFRALFLTVQGVSGLKPASPGEAEPA